MAEKSCFVVMPIRKEGSDEFRRFRTLYDEWIKPVPLAHGYSVVRADDVTRAGAITQDIIIRLAEADLVIADLTTLNPNVFYELGARHSLRGFGTIMILDESGDDKVPFDLGAYRVLKFRSDMYGLGDLRRGLDEYIVQMESNRPETTRDNPVHDWLPSLPVNALASSTGNEEGRLRQQIAEVSRHLDQYRRRYGDMGQVHEGLSPYHRIDTLLHQAQDGSLGSDLVKSAHAAAGRQDKIGYLKAVEAIVQDGGPWLDRRDYIRLISDATSLELAQAASIVFEIARKIYPHDTEIRSAQLAHFVHSFDPAERDLGRQGLLQELGIEVNGDEVRLPEKIDDKNTILVGLLLDSYHQDDINDTALRITSSLTERFPDSTIVLRNHARALEKTGRVEEAFSWYQRSIWCSKPDDTSAVWLGNELHNRRRFVDAMEAYALACVLDPSDATNFAHVADELSRSLDEREYPPAGDPRRRLPEELDIGTLLMALRSATSCELLNQSDINNCVDAASYAGLDEELVGAMLAVRESGSFKVDDEEIRRLRRGERRKFANSLLETLRSPITTNPEAGTAVPAP